jgi:hypothetical protein
MADYFANVSFIVPMNADQQQWAQADLDRRGNYDGDGSDDANNAYPQADIEWHPEHVWFHGDAGDLAALADFLQGVMRQFHIDGAWTFEVSKDCSKERLDAFGGIAAIITRDDIEWLNTERWIEERLAARQLTSPQTGPNPGLASDNDRPHATAGYDFLW